MALRELLLPWTSQPQEAAPLTPLGASAEIVVALPDLRDTLSGATASIVGSVPPESIRAFGRGRTFDSTRFADFALSPAPAFTVLVVFELTTTTGTTTLSTTNSGGNEAAQLRAAAGQLQIVCQSVVNVMSVAAPLVVGRTHCAVFAHDPAAGQGYIVLDGRIVGTTTSTKAYPSRWLYRIGARAEDKQSESATHYQGLHARWPLLLPVDLGVRLSADPWGTLFEPRRIWVPVSSGTVETTVTSAGAAAGSSSAQATGRSSARASGSATASSSAQATGRAVARSTGTAAGSSAAAGVGQSASQSSSAGTSAGSSTASGVGRALATASGASAGSSLAQAVGQSVARSTGTAAGTSTATGSTGSATIAASTGTASASSTATGAGAKVVSAIGVAASSSSASASGFSVASSTGVAAAVSAVVGAAQARAMAFGSSAGTSSAWAIAIVMSDSADRSDNVVRVAPNLRYMLVPGEQLAVLVPPDTSTITY